MTMQHMCVVTYYACLLPAGNNWSWYITQHEGLTCCDPKNLADCILWSSYMHTIPVKMDCVPEQYSSTMSGQGSLTHVPNTTKNYYWLPRIMIMTAVVMVVRWQTINVKKCPMVCLFLVEPCMPAAVHKLPRHFLFRIKLWYYTLLFPQDDDIPNVLILDSITREQVVMVELRQTCYHLACTHDIHQLELTCPLQHHHFAISVMHEQTEEGCGKYQCNKWCTRITELVNIVLWYHADWTLLTKATINWMGKCPKQLFAVRLLLITMIAKVQR